MAPRPVHNGRTTRGPDDDELVLNLDDLRVREIEELEEHTGKSLAEFADALQGGQPLGSLLRVVGYIIKKRDNPDFTMEMAGELKVRMDPTTAAQRKR